MKSFANQNDAMSSLTSRNHIQSSLSGVMGAYGAKQNKFIGTKSTRTLNNYNKKGPLKLP